MTNYSRKVKLEEKSHATLESLYYVHPIKNSKAIRMASAVCSCLNSGQPLSPPPNYPPPPRPPSTSSAELDADQKTRPPEVPHHSAVPAKQSPATTAPSSLNPQLTWKSSAIEKV